MQNKHDDQILDNLAELNDTEIEEILGGWRKGDPIFTLGDHWDNFFTCVSWPTTNQ